MSAAPSKSFRESLPSTAIAQAALAWALGGIIITAGFPAALAASPRLSLMLRASSDPVFVSALSLSVASFLGGSVGSSFMIVVLRRLFPSILPRLASRARVVLAWGLSLAGAQFVAGTIYGMLMRSTVVEAPFAFLGLQHLQPIVLLLLLDPPIAGVAAYIASSATLTATGHGSASITPREWIVACGLWALGFSFAHGLQLLIPEIMPSIFAIDPYYGPYEIAPFVILGSCSFGVAALIGGPFTLGRLRGSHIPSQSGIAVA